MGYETKCSVRVDDRTGVVRQADDATVLIETDDLIVRGPARIRVPRASIERVTARAGIVTVDAPAGIVTLTLGEAADRWRARLEAPPKRLIDKLDVKGDAVVWLLGVDDETLITELRERTPHVTDARSARDCDVVVVGVETTDQLGRIARAARAIRDSGSIWVIHRKGPAGVTDAAIFAAAKAIGLTYVKVARVSGTHTAEKLVRPLVARRQ